MTSAGRSSQPVVDAVVARRTRSARLRRRRRQVALWLAAAIAVGAVSFTTGLLAAPLDYSFQPPVPQAILLLDSHGHVFATIRAPQDEEPVTSNQIPPVVKNAFVAAEDERFFAHRGVDPLAALRAAWRDITGAKLQGGSTITQQYVKNVYTGSQRTALRKLREASLAIRLEQHLSKDQILTRYLNTLYLGNGTAGVQAASRFYYGVPIEQLGYNRATRADDPSLELARAATLAGIAPAPSVWNPLRDRKKARDRELYVLNQMVKNSMISSQQASDAFALGLPHVVAQSEPDAPTIAPEFRDIVDRRLQRTFGAEYDAQLFTSGGVKVTTTLDLDLQQAAVDALHQVLPKGSDPEAAIAAIDPRNGNILAIAQKTDPGRSYRKMGFIYARDIQRSSGSTIKPFTLAAALEEGRSLDDVVSAPNCLDYRDYHPCNAERGNGGVYTLRTALEQSINTVYIPLALQVGLSRVFGLAARAGFIDGPLDRGCGSAPHPQLCLSQAIGVPTSPFNEARAFGVFVDHGVLHEANSLLRVQSGLDGTLFQSPGAAPATRVMPARIADAVTGVLQGVVDHGTGTAAQQPFPVYGKTGTTDHFLNAWFTGCTRSVCISVWMGYEKEYEKVPGSTRLVPHSMLDVEGVHQVFGGTLPAEIFARMLSDYRALSRPAPSPSPSASATPTPTGSVRSSAVSPTPRATTVRPTPSHRPSSPPSTPTGSPSESPSPSPSRTLLPTPR